MRQIHARRRHDVDVGVRQIDAMKTDRVSGEDAEIATQFHRALAVPVHDKLGFAWHFGDMDVDADTLLGCEITTLLDSFGG